jgi:YD repeat-containing protein
MKNGAPSTATAFDCVRADIERRAITRPSIRLRNAIDERDGDGWRIGYSWTDYGRTTVERTIIASGPTRARALEKARRLLFVVGEAKT